MFALAPRARGGNSARQSKMQSPVAAKDGDALSVGRRVRTYPKGLLGVVRWVGPTHFSAGVWIGVELDTRDGRNDGEVQGSRYFTCASGHGVFVRPDHCVVLKGGGGGSTGVPSSSTPGHDRRTRGSFGNGEKAPLTRKGSHASLVSETLAPSGIPTGAWGNGSEMGSGRKENGKRADGGNASEKKTRGGSDDQIIGRLLASEAFSRVLAAAVTDRVRAEVASREAEEKAERQTVMDRMCELEQMLDDAGGAMDDIASMVQTISESVEASPAEPDLRDAAAGGGGGSGDAGGGGRDDARVAELTKLLCTVHDMSSQAADLLRSERKENQVRVQYLTDRVRELENSHKSSPPPEAAVPGEEPETTEPMEG